MSGFRKSIAVFSTTLLLSTGFALGQINQSTTRQTYREISKVIDQLRPLRIPLLEPQDGDWLKTHPEKTQSFREYVESKPVTLSDDRKSLYIQPIGILDETEAEVVELVAEFLGIYYQCSTQVLPRMDLSDVPNDYQRLNPSTEALQVRTDYLLREKLLPILPEDGVAVLGLTNVDLWPGEGWNFVFGHAMYRERVGVWSLRRLRNQGEMSLDKKLLLHRALKVASHETGHMFSIPHCVQAACNMQGSNSLEESDRQPLHLCPECSGKVLFATNANAMRCFEELRDFCATHQLAASEYYQQAIQNLK